MYDIVIIGSGPVGMFATYYGSLRGQNICLIDKLPKMGGQLSALYPEKYIYDIAGFPRVKAKDLVENLAEQLKAFPENFHLELGQEVLEVSKIDKTFEIKTQEKTIKTKSVILAGGNGGFEPRRLGVENEDSLNIDYFIENPQKYKDLEVVIFGGGDSAVDFSLLLNDIAKKVSIVHRRDKFRAHAKSVEQLDKTDVKKYTPFTPKEISYDGNKYHVTITSKDEEKTIQADKVICNFGFISKLGPIEKFGLEINENKVIVDSKQSTNVPGFFAIGDICKYPGKINLIATGFGEGPIAITEAINYINPDEIVGTVHSTSLFEK